MRRILICTGVLGGGTALVFGAAALTAVLVPPSRIAPQGQNVVFERGWPAKVAPVQVDVVVDGVRLSGDLLELPAPGEAR